MSKEQSKWHRPELEKSDLVHKIPMACQNEDYAVEFLEAQRWGETPCCIHCGSTNVYKMTDAKTGGRNKRYLWRCRDCKEQYTVRIGTVYEESRIELRHWCYAFWRAATSKKGVAALEIMRHCQISYKSALFLMNRIRFAMAPEAETTDKLIGIVEVDEVYVGGKPRPGDGKDHKRGRGTSKTPVFVAVERGGNIRRKVIPNVTAKTLQDAIYESVANSARIMSDEFPGYTGLGRYRSHEVVCHSTGEYARGDVHTNTAESSNALVKRGIYGIYHSISKKYTHRYLWQFDFVWNHRKMNDGDRTVATIKAAEGKRLMYSEPTRPN
jgi:transposase-like protein